MRTTLLLWLLFAIRATSVRSFALPESTRLLSRTRRTTRVRLYYHHAAVTRRSLHTIFQTSPQSHLQDTTSGNNNNKRLIALKLPDATDRKGLLSASAFCLLDILFRRLFAKYELTFPSALGGCSLLFVLLCLVPSKIKLYQCLTPGATLLAKWLPVFFVPSLITLPLADSVVGDIGEVLKVGSVVVGGFFFTLLSTAWSVSKLRTWRGVVASTTTTNPTDNHPTTTDNNPTSTTPITQPKAFSDSLLAFLVFLTSFSFVSAGCTNSTILQNLFLLSTTLLTFCFGSRLPSSFTKLVHPLVTCTTLTWSAMVLFGTLFRVGIFQVLQSYTKRGGAGNVLYFLLGPAVVSLAISVYEKKALVVENLPEVGTALTVSTLGGLFGTAVAVRLLNLASPYLRLSLLSRNITSPLAMAIATILGADVSLAVSMVVVTGLIGANFGAAILDRFGQTDAVARGLSIGAAAHGLGTAAFANEKDAFPFSVISMALTATAATTIVSIPFFRKALLQLALGA